MSEFVSVERINSLKQGIEAKTGETYSDMTGGVQALMDGYRKGGSGGEVVLPDTDDTLYVALSPSKYEEKLALGVEMAVVYANNVIAKIGRIDSNGKFAAESTIDVYKGSVVVPPHEDVIVMEFTCTKTTISGVENRLIGYGVPENNQAAISEIKVNFSYEKKPIGLQMGNRETERITFTRGGNITVNQLYSSFSYCGAKEIDLSDFSYVSQIGTDQMFKGCRARKICIPNLLDSGSTTKLTSFFEDCRTLKIIHGLDTWNLSGVKQIDKAFMNCSALETLDLSSWGKYSGGFTKIDGFNRWCTALKTMNLSNWNVGHLTVVYDVFDGCSDLENIIMDNTTWVASNINLTTCAKLTVESLMAVINALPEAAKTLTLGATNKAKLTEEQIAVATGKGWTVA